jgi:hypothetical protein
VRFFKIGFLAISRLVQPQIKRAIVISFLFSVDCGRVQV